jgi:hypothetical protein
MRASCLPETSRRALVANAREDSPVSDALVAIPEKRDAYLSPSRFSTRSSPGTAALFVCRRFSTHYLSSPYTNSVFVWLGCGDSVPLLDCELLTVGSNRH